MESDRSGFKYSSPITWSSAIDLQVYNYFIYIVYSNMIILI